jgi:Tfp pilus assembly protein PilF
MVAALNAAPRDAKTRLVAAQWAWETGQLDEAKQQADAALRLDPKYLEAKILRGVIAMFQKDYKAAEVYFESAHQQSSKDFAASNNLALALAEQNDEPKKAYALDLANANAQKYPRMIDALSTYGWVLYRRGQLDDAEKVLRAVATGGSLTADTAYYWACILKDRGQEAVAKQWLESALRSPAPFLHREEAKALLAKLSETPKK